MKENVVEVLMFLFDNYLGLQEEMPPDERSLSWELQAAGFHSHEINKAFDWLGELADSTTAEAALQQPTSSAYRIYLPVEMQKLDVACRGYLLNLEKMGLLDILSREIIIDRAMALESAQLSLAEFKRIIGLVMLNRISDEEALPWLDEILSDEIASSLH